MKSKSERNTNRSAHVRFTPLAIYYPISVKLFNNHLQCFINLISSLTISSSSNIWFKDQLLTNY